MLKGLELKDAVEKIQGNDIQTKWKYQKTARKPKKETEKKFWN